MYEPRLSIPSPIPNFPYLIQEMRTKNIILVAQPHLGWVGERAHEEII